MEVTNLKDMDGWPIVIGCRVRITMYTLKSGKNVYRHGEVIRVYETPTVLTEKGEVPMPAFVEVRLFKNLNCISAFPAQCKVMKGKTRNSFQYELVKEKFRRLK